VYDLAAVTQENLQERGGMNLQLYTSVALCQSSCVTHSSRQHQEGFDVPTCSAAAAARAVVGNSSSMSAQQAEPPLGREPIRQG
jgi:hypothetical protein